MFDTQSSPMRLRDSALGTAPSTTPKQVTSATLFEGAQELRIEHHGQEYRLRETRNGKLILTK